MMKTYNRTTLWTFVLWLFIVPPGIIYLFLNYNHYEINWLHILIYTLFGFVTLLYPIKRSGRPLIFSHVGHNTCFSQIRYCSRSYCDANFDSSDIIYI